MAKLGRTIANLARYAKAMESMAATAGAAEPGRLVEVSDFGANPGNLRMLAHVPAQVGPRPGLVVVLHGCKQNAGGYDQGTGWSDLADRHGFLLLVPEQRPANNPNNCFSWFEPGDTRRGAGEAASIRAMVAWMVREHGVDEERIFVTGLSAGGAMTAVMLATYPEVFAAGAIVAGLPYGSAQTMQEAFEGMFTARPRAARAWGDLVREASPHRGPWPRVSVWHGSADTTVVPANADEIVKQWTDVHGLNPGAAERTREGTAERAVWRDRSGAVAVESFSIPGLAHGTPLDTGPGEACCGRAGPFLLEAGISSTHHIARFFGLLDGRAETRPAEAVIIPPAPRAAPERPVPPQRELAAFTAPRREEPRPGPGPGGRTLPIDVEAVINKALRAAGLIKP
ncbi:extracellular catalytic domain type 1 short-chain-length polyhydroxyalkanoate depolymerase [Salinarimonas soli]|uniref:PHB depolymerase family esterase n=1 Tax=Salinarimonas soli TaxID=1638099 RepID=A0A5B2V8A1_9HYPH|nr:PHB depolymerase family esterase [Salinarimonas soli]KAA2234680.1 PHB depolymerase family esterase [Salinarimonas soli]